MLSLLDQTAFELVPQVEQEVAILYQRAPRLNSVRLDAVELTPLFAPNSVAQPGHDMAVRPEGFLERASGLDHAHFALLLLLLFHGDIATVFVHLDQLLAESQQ